MKRWFLAWIAVISLALSSVLLPGCDRGGSDALNSQEAEKNRYALAEQRAEKSKDTVPRQEDEEKESVLSEQTEGERSRTGKGSVPLLSCLYFDESSFINAVSSAVVYDDNISGLKGGIVPHHLLAGAMIASFWKTVSRQDYDLIVIIGPDHNRKGRTAITTVSSGFATIYGDVWAEEGLVNALIGENLLSEDAAVMEADHALSSHMPFISYYMPGTPILPLLVKGNCGAEKIKALSDSILSLTEGRNVLFVASMDFSHYLPLEEANRMDEYTEKALADFDCDRIMGMTNDHLDSRPSAVFLLNTMIRQTSKTMVKWDHSNSDIISNSDTGYTTSYFLFGFFEESEKTQPMSQGTVNIMAVGDIMLGRGVADSLKACGLDFIYPFQEVRSILDRGDIVFGNLEHPITERKESLDPAFKYILKCEKNAVSGLTFAGFNVLSLANNHIMDYYEGGLTDTLEILDSNGIARTGAGRNPDEARNPAVVEINGVKVGFLAYSDFAEAVYKGNPSIKFGAEAGKGGVAPLKPEYIREDIEKIRKDVDILAVSLHWGIEDSYEITDRQTEIAHRICDFGADIILGHHPHRFQGIEIYHGKPIVYSLGNFIFDQVPENQESFILSLTYEGSTLVGLEASPVRTTAQNQVVPLDSREAEEMVARQLQLSQALGTQCRFTEPALVYQVHGVGSDVSGKEKAEP